MGSYSEKQIEKMLAPGPVLYPGRIKSKSLTNYTGTDIHYIGDRCFAFSGRVAQNGGGSANATMNNFVSGPDFIMARFSVTTNQSSGHDFYFTVTLNGTAVVFMKEASNTIAGWPYVFDLLIPPFAAVETLWGSNDNSYTAECNITGTVHAATTTDIGGL